MNMTYDGRSCWEKGQQHDPDHYDPKHPAWWICKKCHFLGANIELSDNQKE